MKLDSVTFKTVEYRVGKVCGKFVGPEAQGSVVAIDADDNIASVTFEDGEKMVVGLGSAILIYKPEQKGIHDASCTEPNDG